MPSASHITFVRRNICCGYKRLWIGEARRYLVFYARQVSRGGIHGALARETSGGKNPLRGGRGKNRRTREQKWGTLSLHDRAAWCNEAGAQSIEVLEVPLSSYLRSIPLVEVGPVISQ